MAVAAAVVATASDDSRFMRFRIGSASGAIPKKTPGMGWDRVGVAGGGTEGVVGRGVGRGSSRVHLPRAAFQQFLRADHLPTPHCRKHTVVQTGQRRNRHRRLDGPGRMEIIRGGGAGWVGGGWRGKSPTAATGLAAIEINAATRAAGANQLH